MLNNCVNPLCRKPLHYLRDGRVYLFPVAAAAAGKDAAGASHLEHYWLCGDCAQSMTLIQDSQQLRVVPRRPILAGPSDLAAWETP